MNMVVMLNELQITPLAEGVESCKSISFTLIGVELIPRLDCQTVI